MGNTCFINTAIQCLSSVRPLTDYLLSNLHIVSLNKTNPFGSKGEIAESFGKLVQDIYKGKDERIYPENFLKVLEKHAPHLVSGHQQDCQEFLAFLLDSLHEDMNRVNRTKRLEETK